MKKINKTRKITENDIRNLHYIHENEELIPSGITKLEDKDITSAEVITENKNSKVNEELDEYLKEFIGGKYLYMIDWEVDTNHYSMHSPDQIKEGAVDALKSCGYNSNLSYISKEDLEKIISKNLKIAFTPMYVKNMRIVL